MTYYKILSTDGTSPYQSFQWDLPKNGKPGKWMPRVKGKLAECLRGYHVLKAGQLSTWIVADALFEVEVKGKVVDFRNKCACHQARLTRHVETWNEMNLRLFAADCAEHVLPLFERRYPNDDRPRKAIEVARKFARGEVTGTERDAAWAAAWAAAGDAAWDAARDAVWAVAWAAAGAAERKWQSERLMHYLEIRPGEEAK